MASRAVAAARTSRAPCTHPQARPSRVVARCPAAPTDTGYLVVAGLRWTLTALMPRLLPRAVMADVGEGMTRPENLEAAG